MHFRDDSSAYITLYTTVHYIMYIYSMSKYHSLIGQNISVDCDWTQKLSPCVLVGTVLYRQRKQDWADHKLGSVIKYQPRGSGRVNCGGINIQYTCCLCIQVWSYYTKNKCEYHVERMWELSWPKFRLSLVGNKLKVKRYGVVVFFSFLKFNNFFLK